MSTLIIARSHALPPQLVAGRLDAMAAELTERAEIRWQSSSELVFNATGLTGSIVCHPAQIVATLRVSGAMRLVKSQIEKRMNKMFDELMRDPAQTASPRVASRVRETDVDVGPTSGTCG